MSASGKPVRSPIRTAVRDRRRPRAPAPDCSARRYPDHARTAAAASPTGDPAPGRPRSACALDRADQHDASPASARRSSRHPGIADTSPAAGAARLPSSARARPATLDSAEPAALLQRRAERRRASRRGQRAGAAAILRCDAPHVDHERRPESPEIDTSSRSMPSMLEWRRRRPGRDSNHCEQRRMEGCGGRGHAERRAGQRAPPRQSPRSPPHARPSPRRRRH